MEIVVNFKGLHLKINSFNVHSISKVVLHSS